MLPGFVRWAALKLLKIFKDDPIFSGGLRNSRVRSTTEEWDVVRQKNDYVKQFYKKVYLLPFFGRFRIELDQGLGEIFVRRYHCTRTSWACDAAWVPLTAYTTLRVLT
jgi:hypothetical protein